MNTRLRILACITSFVLASCGGGGGGSGGTGGPPIGGGGPQPVALTEGNAKPVAANALEASQNTAAVRGATGLPTGVQLETGANVPTLLAIAGAARFAAAHAGSPGLPAGVAISETEVCALGGTMTISGNVANPNVGLAAGDTVTLSTTACAFASGGATTVMNGQMSMTVVSGTISTLPFHAVLATTATNLSVQSGGVTVVSNGDLRLDWNATSATTQTLVATGNSLSNRISAGGTTRTTTMRNYTQSLAINGSIFTGSLSATIETDSTRIGSTAVSYTIATPTPVVWNATTRTASAGVVRVTGADNSQLLLTINGNGTATIQLDANGDGTFERTIPTDVAELGGLL